jgi:hypothetical protein
MQVNVPKYLEVTLVFYLYLELTAEYSFDDFDRSRRQQNFQPYKYVFPMFAV